MIPPLGITARCRVTKVVDGDTLDVELRIPVRVRLLNNWAPESRTKDAAERVKGLAAKQRLIDEAEGNYGKVFIPTDHATSVSDVLTLGRVLGQVWIDGLPGDLSQRQVLAGLASTTKGGALGE